MLEFPISCLGKYLKGFSFIFIQFLYLKNNNLYERMKNIIAINIDNKTGFFIKIVIDPKIDPIVRERQITIKSESVPLNLS